MATLTKVKDLCKEEFKDGEYLTGYQNLDEIIEGISKGTVITIGGRPGMGKTAFGQNIMLKMLEKYNLSTLYISLETGKNIALESLLALYMNQSLTEFRADEKALKAAKLSFEKEDKNLYISDDCFNVSDLEDLLNKNKDIKCLFIDYIQLMEVDTEYGAKNKTNDVVNQIKKIAKEKNLIVFLLAQLSRNVEYRENKRPLLVDLRDSGNLESNSDIVLFLYRNDYYDVKSDNDSQIIEVIVAKNRIGSSGTSFLVFDQGKRIFKDFK